MERYQSSDRLYPLGTGTVAYAPGLVPKNFDSQPSLRIVNPEKERAIRKIGEFEIGLALHTVVALVAEGKDKKARQKITSLATSARWRNTFGWGTERVANFIGSAAQEMVGRIREGREGIILFSEQKVMASNKARMETADVLTEQAGSVGNLIRFPLERHDTPLVPLTVHPFFQGGILDTNPVGDAQFIAYGLQAIPDLIGFEPKTQDAKKLLQPLKQLLYQDNEGTRRYLLNPDLLRANKGLIQNILQAILKKELAVTIFEMKTAPWRGSSIVDEPDELVVRKYSADISHTVLALLQIFKAAAPHEFKGRQQLRTTMLMLQGTSVELGLVDFPALLPIAGQVEPIVPTVGSVKTRLVTVPTDKVREGCARRMLMNEKYFRK